VYRVCCCTPLLTDRQQVRDLLHKSQEAAEEEQLRRLEYNASSVGPRTSMRCSGLPAVMPRTRRSRPPSSYRLFRERLAVRDGNIDPIRLRKPLEAAIGAGGHRGPAMSGTRDGAQLAGKRRLVFELNVLQPDAAPSSMVSST